MISIKPGNRSQHSLLTFCRINIKVLLSPFQKRESKISRDSGISLMYKAERDVILLRFIKLNEEDFYIILDICS